MTCWTNEGYWTMIRLYQNHFQLSLVYNLFMETYFSVCHIGESVRFDFLSELFLTEKNNLTDVCSFVAVLVDGSYFKVLSLQLHVLVRLTWGIRETTQCSNFSSENVKQPFVNVWPEDARSTRAAGNARCLAFPGSSSRQDGTDGLVSYTAWWWPPLTLECSPLEDSRECAFMCQTAVVFIRLRFPWLARFLSSKLKTDVQSPPCKQTFSRRHVNKGCVQQ